MVGPNVIGGDASGGVQPGAVKANLHTQLEVVRSTEILSLKAGEFRQLQTFRDADSVIKELKDDLIVEVGEKDELLTVAYDTPYRDEAPVIVNGIVEAFRRFHTDEGESTAKKLQAILTAKYDQTRAELDQKSKQVVNFKRQHGVLEPDSEKGDVHREKLSGILTALTAATTDRINAELAYRDAIRTIEHDQDKMAMMAQVKDQSAIRVISPQDAETLRSELFQWQARLQDLQQQYLPSHPRVRGLRERVDQLNVYYVAAMENRWATSKQREWDLQQAYDQQNKLAIERSADAAEYARMSGEVDRLTRLLENLQSEITKINLAQAAESAVKVNVLEPARPPESPVSPNTTRSLGIAFVVGAMLGVVLACLRDWSDPRLRTPDEVKAALGLPVLGMVPKMPEELAPAVRGQQILLEPLSSVAEAYRSLRTAVKFGVPGGNCKTILVTSPAPGDGKSTLASNLAIALAQVGKRVLLLDADLRRPGQHEIFGVENAAGLSDVLEREAAGDAVVQKTTVENLEIIPSGPLPESPAEALNSQRLVDLLDALADKYDHVVIDSAPTLLVTDARIVAASCDVSVLVLHADRADRRQAELARDGLAGVGAHVLGVVLNGVPRRSPAHGYVDDGGYFDAPGDDLPPPAAPVPGAGPAVGAGGSLINTRTSASPLVAIQPPLGSMDMDPRQITPPMHPLADLQARPESDGDIDTDPDDPAAPAGERHRRRGDPDA